MSPWNGSKLMRSGAADNNERSKHLPSLILKANKGRTLARIRVRSYCLTSCGSLWVAPQRMPLKVR